MGAPPPHCSLHPRERLLTGRGNIGYHFSGGPILHLLAHAQYLGDSTRNRLTPRRCAPPGFSSADAELGTCGFPNTCLRQHRRTVLAFSRVLNQPAGTAEPTV